MKQRWPKGNKNAYKGIGFTPALLDERKVAMEKKKKAKGFIAEFKEFISRGSVMDLAVGIIIGAAFTAIVNSLVNDLVMPLVGLLVRVDFTEWSFTVGGATFNYGLFISAVINFILIALVVFLLVKGINAFRKKEGEAEPPRLCPYCRTEIDKEATRCPHCTSVLEGVDAAKAK